MTSARENAAAILRELLLDHLIVEVARVNRLDVLAKALQLLLERLPRKGGGSVSEPLRVRCCALPPALLSANPRVAPGTLRQSQA